MHFSYKAYLVFMHAHHLFMHKRLRDKRETYPG